MLQDFRSFFFQKIQVNLVRISFDFSYYNRPFSLIYGNKINSVFAVPVPIAGDDIIHARFLVLLTEIPFKYKTGICLVICIDFIADIFQILDFYCTPVFVNEPEPKVQKVIRNGISDFFAVCPRQVWPFFLYYSEILSRLSRNPPASTPV